MEDKLRQIITKIETSQLLDADKDELYGMIQAGLQATVLPVLLKYMNKDELKDLAGNPAKITVDAYVKLVGDSLKNPAAFPEIVASMEGLLSEVEKGLVEAKV